MKESILMDPVILTIVGSIIGILLGIIAFFLSRLLSQFDKLNATMMKIDKDLTGEIGILKAQQLNHDAEITGLHMVWDRMRRVENEIAVLNVRIK